MVKKELWISDCEIRIVFVPLLLNSASRRPIRNSKSEILLMPNPLKKLIAPWYPATALELEKGSASMVQLEGGRANSFGLRRAASVALPDSLIQPGFEEPNIADWSELAEALSELA